MKTLTSAFFLAMCVWSVAADVTVADETVLTGYYECSAQDVHGEIYSVRGRVNPPALQQNAINNCEFSSNAPCLALGCVHVD